MKKTLIGLVLMTSSLMMTPRILAADACTVPAEHAELTKVLQGALSIHQDVKQEMVELQALVKNLDGSAAEVAEQILKRVGESKANLQDAFSQLDNTADLPLILAQAQGRLTAALGKYRGFKTMTLDDSKRERIQCSEQRLQELNQRLQEILKAPL
ncbi:MAG TPA: hypothetical protein VE954_20405 [Oligoflexus sp.]|uniref:hypothetical protein n=1 Tax=Oligoflexus sp. TaxID=1971216 RepID=UPI002D32A679|nr:hypothetical protein [Oligoflexus sp.]HYX35464.1 hypothetical protein [Oligoflexus sp.]